ncbi:hypothetical protein HPP92_019060 [Vanilla planifolia]|uniref:Reverse transcriptase/retrotransposon-derived protein RNase H-like domain-containing protein n=1 Tax=Vanilla planifolia TaxID=51239 RepID=A0A835Q682_VANPL|nr:hypothetical protein HPP92_019060 [Vanilla planifolia]
MMDAMVSVVVVREEDNMQKPIPYVNQALKDPKIHYPSLKRLMLALFISSLCQQPHFHANEIKVVIDKSLHKILHFIKVYDCFHKWVMDYTLRISTNSQVLAYFSID